MIQSAGVSFNERFQNELCCICNNKIIFDLIDEIECDWGSHSVIQCPKCEELFSIDKKCIAFTSVLELLKYNPGLYSDKEQAEYAANSHRLLT